MVLFKGHSSIKQYLPKKPHKWGYKIFILCDSRGVVHSFDVYTGRIDQVPGFPDIGPSGNIVIKLAQCVQPQLGHLLYFDNWFTSLKLLVTLAQRGIYALGTVRVNRLQGRKMASDTELRKRGRGSAEECEAVVDNQKVIVVKWYDNRSVTTATPLEMKKRRGPTSHIPNEDVRTDSTGHWPVVKDTRQRCKKPGRKGHTNVMCSQCNAHLCLNKNTNCFFDFHQP
ncbi:piggyBac transposable element-derived protein 1-like [Ixodes scapularis]|uniref:piggyBac transposable element-derived protein 1-like n=1 Tax=Ixodes scapularis TaxID=6945 RepID=UPI001A9D9EDE|nr:piggyBac transposable element-derived protein 1-like [Ixodes scapularis]